MKTFRKIIRCQWGTETYKGFTESEDNFRGFSAPLWVNTSPGAFLIMFLWGMSVFFILLLVYIFYISGIETSCTTNFKTIIIFELIVVAINTIFDYLSYTTKYDSDQGWSRTLVYLSLQVAFLAIFGFLGIIETLTNNFQNCTYDKTTGAACEKGAEGCLEDNTEKLAISSIAVTVNILLLLLIKLGLLIAFSLKYYYKPSQFLAVAKQGKS